MISGFVADSGVKLSGPLLKYAHWSSVFYANFKPVFGMNQKELNFRLYHLRFSFVARESIYFPPGKAANLLRGAFGVIFSADRLRAALSRCEGL